MARFKHDFVDPNGFFVEPELLAHDLALLRLSEKDTQSLSDQQLYEEYLETLHSFMSIIDDKTRMDSIGKNI